MHLLRLSHDKQEFRRGLFILPLMFAVFNKTLSRQQGEGAMIMNFTAEVFLSRRMPHIRQLF